MTFGDRDCPDCGGFGEMFDDLGNKVPCHCLDRYRNMGCDTQEEYDDYYDRDPGYDNDECWYGDDEP